MGAPGSSMHGMAKVKANLTSGANMHLFFEKGMIGCVSYISQKYSEANNKYLKSYDPKKKKKKSQNIYSHTKNFHDYVMSKFLPTGKFNWVAPNKFELNKYSSNS